MGRFLDLLTGHLYSFRNANGADVNLGASDKLIVTPQSLKQSDVFCNTSIPLVLPSLFRTKSALFVVNSNVLVIPTNGYFFPSRSNNIKTQLFANTIVDAGLIGELCLVDLSNNSIVANSTTSFNNSTYATISSNVFFVEAGKAYAIAIRRSFGIASKFVSLRALTLTLKLLAA
jgi:hypothetical protein